MSAFLRTDAGEINSQFIVSIKTVHVGREADGVARFRKRVKYLEGDEVLTTMSEAMSTDAINGTIIPAMPGYFTVYVYDDPPHEIYTRLIVAWRVEGDIATPVGLDDCGGRWAILDPQGRVTQPWDCSFDTVEDYRQYRIKEIQRRSAAPSLPVPPPVPFAEVE